MFLSVKQLENNMNKEFFTIISNFEQSDLVQLIKDLVEKEQIGQAAIEAIVADRPIPHY